MTANATITPVPSVQLAYSSASSRTRLAGVLRTPSGPCEIALRRETDAAGALVQLHLSFRCRHVAHGSDLLDKVYPRPGYQPFMFAASDLAGGPAASAFGTRRTLAVPQARVALHIRVLSARVVQRPASCEDKAELLALTLRVSTSPAASRSRLGRDAMGRRG